MVIKLRKKDAYSEEIKRIWGDVEVVDAAKDLRVFVQPCDIDSAIKKDPGCCVFAQACKRQFAATKVLFWKHVAYVELPGPDGKRRVERFHLSVSMRKLIENFDKGDPILPEAGFELKTVPPSEAFGQRAKRNAKRLLQKKARKEALLNGTINSGGNEEEERKAKDKTPQIIDLEVRNGSGRVRFVKSS